MMSDPRRAGGGEYIMSDRVEWELRCAEAARLVNDPDTVECIKRMVEEIERRAAEEDT